MEDNATNNTTTKSAKTILIVEDDKFLRDMLVNKFEDAGFQVNAATTGEDAFKMLARRKPNLITLDLLMPDVDGLQVVQKLKTDPGTSGIPILILSNLMEKGDIDRAMAAGAAYYMVKANSTPNEIVARAKELVEKNQ